MSPSISNGSHIHDTLTSGLRLDIDLDTYARIKTALCEKENTPDKKNTFELWDDTYTWSVNKDKHRAPVKGKDYGTAESYSWQIKMYRQEDGEHYTSMGVKVSIEKDKAGANHHYLTVTANPTALMRNDYAIDVTGVDASHLLTSPFELLAEICGGVDTLAQKEWRTIDRGDLLMRDVEIAFPLMIDEKYDKQSVILNFMRIYGVRMSFKNKILDIGDVLNCQFQRYPEDSTVSQSTGFQIQSKDQYGAGLFTLTLYDKVEEMKVRKKQASQEDKKRVGDIWQKYLRVDIRVYPAFVRKLSNLSREHSVKIADWLDLEKSKPKFSRWLLKQVLDNLEFHFLSSTVDEVKSFADEMGEKFGQKAMERWLSSVTYTFDDLGIKQAKSTWSKFLQKQGAPAKLGGLVFNMQNAFNFTSVLNLEDLKDVFTINDLTKRINEKRGNQSYDEKKIDFREPIYDFCNY